MHSPFRSQWMAIFLIGTILLFSGCFSPSKNTQVSPVFTVKTLEGTLYSLGNPNVTEENSNTPTHLLGLEDGTMIYAYSASSTVNLDDLSYKGVKVNVTGNLYSATTESDKDTLAITSIELATPETTETSAIVEMKTFRHSTLNFTISYRSDWYADEGVVDGTGTAVTFTAPIPPPVDLSELPEGIVFEAQETPRDTIQITVQENLGSLPVEEWYTVYTASTEGGTHYFKSAVSKDQLPAIKTISYETDTIFNEQREIITYYVEHGTTIFIISHAALQPDYELEYSTLFSEMLYSFDVDGVDEIVSTAVTTSTPETPTDDTTETPTNDTSSNTSTTTTSSDHQATIDTLKTQLNSLVPDAGDWTPTRYSFVDPDYVYVEYQDSTTGTKGRLLVRDLGGSFEVLAVFKEGETTDWTLVSGTNEASGLPQTSVNATSGQAYSIPEGYALFESSSLQFSMPYPSRWYYSRSGDSFYFSDKPADATNALVTLTILSTSVPAYTATTDASLVTVQVPRDDASGYQFQGDAQYQAIMETMAQGIVSTKP